ALYTFTRLFVAQLSIDIFFFFSSRRRHTRFSRDWSSDVCSSDLPLSMQKIRQILLFVERGFSQRSIERETGINRRTIAGYIKTFTASGLSIQELLLFN